MTALEVYQTVMAPPAATALSQSDFIRYINAAQLEIGNLYSDKYAANPDTILRDVSTIQEGLNLRDEYFDAVCDRVRFLATGDERYNNSFGGKAQAAYLRVWRELSRGKKVKKNDWRVRNV